jgi:hypothetical protein
MALLVDLEEPANVDVRVLLGRGQAGVAKKLLNDAQIGAPAEEV